MLQRLALLFHLFLCFLSVCSTGPIVTKVLLSNFFILSLLFSCVSALVLFFFQLFLLNLPFFPAGVFFHFNFLSFFLSFFLFFFLFFLSYSITAYLRECFSFFFVFSFTLKRFDCFYSMKK